MLIQVRRRAIGYTVGVAVVLIALGSNVGDSLENLCEATRCLGTSLCLDAASHVYETAPMYVTDQPVFLNAAVLVRTTMSPRALLAHLKELEQQIGRQRRQPNGPREIDLDLIAYGALFYRYFEGKNLRLQVPHPRIGERRFVLQPLSDIAPEFMLPGIGIVSDLLKQTEDQADSVKKVEHAVLPVQRHE